MRLSKEQLIQKIKQALKQVGTSQMSQSPYDLGWLLRLPAGRHGLPDSKNPRKPRYPQIISWLEKLQHKDGSWGGQISFAHDRVISTLSVIAGLSRWSLYKIWRGRIAKAAKAVELYSKKLLKESEATVAFELLFPKLLNDCEKAGVKIKIPARVLNYYSKLKKEKLSKLPIEAATKQPTTLLHALEALDDNIDFPLSDLDDTSLVFYVLQKNKKKPNIIVFKKFETDRGFVCYEGERSGSASHYIHLFFALSTCQNGNSRIARMRRKIINYLSRAQTNQVFWNDKWHISPYYATSRAILALAGHPETEPMVNKATQWILKTQHKNGLWGFGKGTAEETVYVLMALQFCASSKAASPIIDAALMKQLAKIIQLSQNQFSPMWVAKVLHAPCNIIGLTIDIITFQCLNRMI